MKKKGYAKGTMMKKKGYSKGGSGSKLKMVKKNGKMVPFYAADGVGKMYGGGMAMKKKGMAKGGMKVRKMNRGAFLAPAARPLKMRKKGAAKGGKRGGKK